MISLQYIYIHLLYFLKRRLNTLCPQVIYRKILFRFSTHNKNTEPLFFINLFKREGLPLPWRTSIPEWGIGFWAMDSENHLAAIAVPVPQSSLVANIMQKKLILCHGPWLFFIVCLNDSIDKISILSSQTLDSVLLHWLQLNFESMQNIFIPFSTITEKHHSFVL